MCLWVGSVALLPGTRALTQLPPSCAWVQVVSFASGNDPTDAARLIAAAFVQGGLPWCCLPLLLPLDRIMDLATHPPATRPPCRLHLRPGPG